MHPRWLYGILLCFALLVGSLIFLTEGIFGGADSYQHFQIAAGAFKHPELFLDHWGKPVFTILLSVFAQFDLHGTMIFNLLAALGSAWVGTKIMKKLGFDAPILIPLTILTVPIFFQCIFSGLTEPLFALILLIGIWTFLSDRHWICAISISLLPLVRTEGIILIPLFVAALIWVRQYKPLLGLLVAPLAYSFIGWLALGFDFWWLITQQPYGQGNLYGSGELLHYVIASPQWLGWPLTILLLPGLVMSLYQIRQFRDRKVQLGWALVILCFLVYCGAHSWAWWHGGASSLGLHRIMAGVAPLGAIIGVGALIPAFKKLRERPSKFTGAQWATSFVLILLALLSINIPFERSFDEQIMYDAGQRIQQSSSSERLYAYNPEAAYYANRDIFDPTSFQQLHDAKAQFAPNSWILWDSHFGPKEGKTPIEAYLYHNQLSVEAYLTPPPDSLTGFQNPYETYLFRYHTEEVNEVEVDFVFDLDLGIPSNLNPAYWDSISNTYELSPKSPFMELVNAPLNEFGGGNFGQVTLSANWNTTASDTSQCHLVYTLEMPDTVLSYKTFPLTMKEGQGWSSDLFLPLRPNPQPVRLKCYLWYQGTDSATITSAKARRIRRSGSHDAVQLFP